MLAQALARYADTYLSDQLQDPAFEVKPVAFELVISPDGEFLEVIDRTEVKTEVVKGKEKERRITRTMQVPRSPVARNSTIAPLLGIDSVHYVLGEGPWTSVGKRTNHLERFNAFQQLLAEVAEQTGDAGANAARTFYASASEVDKAKARIIEMGVKEGALVALSLREVRGGIPRPPQAIILRDALKSWWRDHYERAAGEKAKQSTRSMCLISGRVGPIASTHPLIKGVASLGGQPSGVALMSFDKKAFQSYGWEQNENAPVSAERADAYVLALNDLLRKGEHRLGGTADVLLRTRFDLNETAFLYWTDQPVDDDPIGELIDPDAVEFKRAQKIMQDAQTATSVLMAPLSAGSAPEQPLNQFFLVAVSGNGARLVIRRWLSRPLPEIQAAIGRWYDDLSIADVFADGEIAARPSIARIARVFFRPTAKDSDEKNIRGSLVASLMTRALGESSLGLNHLAAVLRQLAHVDGAKRLDPVRMGVIRLLTNDCAFQHNSPESPIMPPTLDETSSDVAYFCGRLFAELESLQYSASNQKLNQSITDRFYSTASRHPARVFPQLLNLKVNYLRKLTRLDKSGAAIAIGRRIDDLVDHIGKTAGSFPYQLNVVEQGRFAIGYHQQHADAARRRSQATASADSGTQSD